MLVELRVGGQLGCVHAQPHDVPIRDVGQMGDPGTHQIEYARIGRDVGRVELRQGVNGGLIDVRNHAR